MKCITNIYGGYEGIVDPVVETDPKELIDYRIV